MNDKEKKAIERLNRILIAESTTNNIGTKIYISDLHTVLNLIEKQQAEIKKKKERIEYLERSISRKEHSLVEEEQDNVELETKLQEKDNIIDLMAEHLEKHSTFFPELYGARAKDWKQYFENKVKESK